MREIEDVALPHLPTFPRRVILASDPRRPLCQAIHATVQPEARKTSCPTPSHDGAASGTLMVSVCERYSYGQIDTPIFEDYNLFVRGVGEVTDIVEKEMYLIPDRSGSDTLALRPEATAAVCRAYLQHGLHTRPQPIRLYTVMAPMFRYSRPQSGRLRQFHQLNVEAIGDPDATVDAEILGLCWQVFAELGLTGLRLQLNSIGDAACRPAYVQALKSYYGDRVEQLCRDCTARLDRAPLRLLDCKEVRCQPFIEGAPRSRDHLCAECEAHFADLVGFLEGMDVPFVLDHRLVRGLDYYTRTVFEVQTEAEGAQNALGGGGRYDGLIEEIGGKPTPGVGFAMGIERIILNLERQAVAAPEPRLPTVFVAYVGQKAQGAGGRAVRGAGKERCCESARACFQESEGTAAAGGGDGGAVRRHYG